LEIRPKLFSAALLIAEKGFPWSISWIMEKNGNLHLFIHPSRIVLSNYGEDWKKGTCV
jgi:hypothetical protein